MINIVEDTNNDRPLLIYETEKPNAKIIQKKNLTFTFFHVIL